MYYRLKSLCNLETKKILYSAKYIVLLRCHLASTGREAHLAGLNGAVQLSSKADLGISIDLKSADKELKAVTPEKSKTCVTAFTKKLVTALQLSRTRSAYISLK